MPNMCRAFLGLALPAFDGKLSTGDFLMHWFERRIRRYEHRRWTTDDNRRVQPFHWGLEHIGGDPADSDPAAYRPSITPDKPSKTARHGSPPPQPPTTPSTPKMS